MRQTSSIVTIAALAFLAGAPAAQEPVDRAMIDKIRREGLDRSHVYAAFTHLVDGIGPRLTATPAFKAAADWSRDRLASFGLRDPRLEAWDFGRGWQLEQFTLEMVEPRYMPLVGYPEGWSASMAGEIVATPVFVGDKTVEEIAAMKATLKGAILLTHPAQTSFVREDRGQSNRQHRSSQLYCRRPAGIQPDSGLRRLRRSYAPYERRHVRAGP